MNPSLSELPMKPYTLAASNIDALEITHQYVNSLPTAGSILQRFGEQVEILHPGPGQKKAYGQVGEYLVHILDTNQKSRYFVLPQIAFRALFLEAPSPMVTLPKDGQEIVAKVVEKPELTKKQKRLKDLQELDNVLPEAPLSEDATQT